MFFFCQNLAYWIINLPSDIKKNIELKGDTILIDKTAFQTPEVLGQVKHSFEKLETCYHCGSPIDKDAVICEGCGKNILKCPVCKLAIYMGDTVGVCSNCSVQGHYSHMFEALKTAGKCPVCKVTLSTESLIKKKDERVSKD